MSNSKAGNQSPGEGAAQRTRGICSTSVTLILLRLSALLSRLVLYKSVLVASLTCHIQLIFLVV